MLIALIRHGPPAAAQRRVVTAAGFARWVRAYEQSRLRAGSRAPVGLRGAVDGCFVLASHRPRAVHSVEVCLGRAPDLCLADLREMEIPRYRLPLRLPTGAWLALNRGLWVLGRSGPFESFREARARARRTAHRLDRLAETHQRLAVFGHGLMNRVLATELAALGWRGTWSGQPYWGTIRLERRW